MVNKKHKFQIGDLVASTVDANLFGIVVFSSADKKELMAFKAKTTLTLNPNTFLIYLLGTPTGLHFDAPSVICTNQCWQLLR